MTIFLGIVGPQVTIYGQTARPQPPMGLDYVFNSVARAGWEPILFDSLAEGYNIHSDNQEDGRSVWGLPIEKVVERVTQVGPDAIGFSLGLSTNHDYNKNYVEEIRKVYDGPIIVGGSHASLMNRRLFDGYPIERIPADFVVTGRDIGSGEQSVYELLKTIETRGDYEKVPGISFVKDGRVITTKPVRVTAESLANLTLPRRDLFQRIDGIDIYSYINQSHTGPVDYPPYAVMHTSRGCGGGCTFCHTRYDGFDPTLIGRSLENIFFELEYLRSDGYQTVSIEDDNFGGFTDEQAARAVIILNRIEQLGFRGVYFPNGMTVRSMSNNDFAILRKLRSMADNGIKVRNSLPIESGSKETLRRIPKPHTLDEVQAALEELKEGYSGHPNILFDAFFMVGVVSPDPRTGEFWREPEESIQKTFELADRVSELGMLVNIWRMAPNPNGPQYQLWRQMFPEKPFSELHFLKSSGIWGSPENELWLDEILRKMNARMNEKGAGSKRPIYPVE